MPLLIFDLDDTLVSEEPTTVATFRATAEAGAERVGVDSQILATDARTSARALWRVAPTHPFAARIGISSWEGLWCRYEGDGPELSALRAWAPSYRAHVWADALALQRVTDPELAAELGDRFGVERRARHHTYPDVAPALASLQRSHRLALLTNGASCLQREKLAASGLQDFFELVVVSGEFGVGKPDPAIFHHVTERLGVSGGVMIGDNLLRDIEGALAAGLRGVLVDRSGAVARERPAGVPLIATLAELPRALAELQ